MDKQTLLKKGGFVKPDLIEFNEVWKHADLENGDPEENYIIENKIVFFVKEASWLELKRTLEGKTFKEGDPEPLDNEALTVSACIRLGENGEESLTYDEVISLEVTLYYIFRAAVFELYAKKKS